MPASSLRAKPGTSSIRPANSRWPSTTSSIGGLGGDGRVAGRLVEERQLAEAAPGPSVATLLAVPADLAVPLDDHEELAAGRALADEDLARLDLHVLGPAGDERQLLLGAGRRRAAPGRGARGRRRVRDMGRESNDRRAPDVAKVRRRLRVGESGSGIGTAGQVASDRTQDFDAHPVTRKIRPRPDPTDLRRHTPCPRPSASTSAPPTRSSRVLEAGEPVVIPNAEGVAHHALGRRLLQDRRGPRRRGGQAPGHHQPRPHDPLGQAPHGHQLDDRHRRQEVHAAGDLAPASCRS